MAKVKNITRDTLSLFRADAPPVHGADCPDPLCSEGCNEVRVRDENFVDRAWPKSTWEVIEEPNLDGYADVSTEDAWLWAMPAPEPEVADELAEQGRQLASEREDLIAAGVDPDALLIPSHPGEPGGNESQED